MINACHKSSFACRTEHLQCHGPAYQTLYTVKRNVSERQHDILAWSSTVQGADTTINVSLETDVICLLTDVIILPVDDLGHHGNAPLEKSTSDMCLVG